MSTREVNKVETTADQLHTVRSDRRANSDHRLAAVVEYVATKLADSKDPYRGAVKLNKIIWWADQESFRRFGYSVSGSEYQRLPQGPVPYRFPVVKEALSTARRIVVTKQDVGAPKPATVLEPGSKSDIEAARRVLGSEDTTMLDEALAKFHGWTGRKASDFSHTESVAWQTLEDGDLIPDSAWLIDPHGQPADFDVTQLLIDNGLSS